MRKQNWLIILALLFLFITGFLALRKSAPIDDSFLRYEVDLQQQDFQLYWKDDQGQMFSNPGNLKNWLANRDTQLVFAMNAGIFKPDHSPQGLFIQDQHLITHLDTTSGRGNFYLKPNGVFYTTTDHRAMICSTENFINSEEIKYATQSGPMLLLDGKMHPAFKEHSTNVNIRNGVGILPNGHPLFAMSKQEINLYDFANYFTHLGCKNALYLDGAISRTYLPGENWIQLDGEFSVLIGVTKH